MILWLVLAAVALMLLAVPPWIVGRVVETVSRSIIRKRKKNN